MSQYARFVDVYDSGVRSFKDVSQTTIRPVVGARRGVIKSFSSASRRRLRLALLSYDLPHCQHYGVCVTVPWRDISPSDAIVQYGRCWNRFQVAFRRAFPFSSAIFRHELQNRKMPHTHLYVYLSNVEQKDYSSFKNHVAALWLRAVATLYGGNARAFCRHGVKVDRLLDEYAVKRYIQDHTSKSKQAQLGYRGKQWGILGKSCLILQHPRRFVFSSQEDLNYFRRTISRVARFCIHDSRVWCGYRKSFVVPLFAVRFVSDCIVDRLLSYMSSPSLYGRVGVRLFSDSCFRIMPNFYDDDDDHPDDDYHPDDVHMSI